MEPASPTNSTVSLTSGDTDWDFISDADQTSTAPASIADYDSDVERARHHAGDDDVNEALSDDDSGDDLGRDSEDDTVHDAVVRESDRRVNEALSNSLHSTLDPFREPLPSFISGSLSSSDSTALILSFPDPLTPSEELRAEAAAARRDDTASPSLPPTPPLTTDIDNVPSAHEDDDEGKVRPPVEETYPTSVREKEDEEAPIGNVAPIELAADAIDIDKRAVDEIIQHTNAADIQKIASYNPRKMSVGSRPRRRRLSFPTSSRVFQPSNVSQSWTTSIIVGILVVVLGSAMYKAGPYNKSTAATVQTPVMVAPSLIPPCTANERVVTPVIDAPKVAITTSSAPLLLQTPGAGPSTLATAGQRGSSSSATTKTNEVKDEVIVKPSLALSVHAPSGTTRQGSATPFIVRNGLCGRGSRKGKEKEIVSEQYTDTGGQTDSMTLDRPLLLEGPKTPLSLGYIIRGVKAVLNDHLPSESQETKSNSITDLLALSTIVNFEELLDELVVRIMSKTTSILQDLSSAAAVHAGSLISAAGQAKVTLERHGSLVRSGAKILVKHVKEQHRMARMGFNAVRAGEFQAVVKAAKMQGYNVKKGCKVVEYGLRSAVVEGQRMLAEAFGGIEAADAVEAEAE